jgi:(E)-4-hydroxy-3-methylbut-2-enyl-diphosphate synthase
MIAPKRRRTRVVSVGGVPVGGSNPIIVQSMTSVKTEDVPATMEQISRLAAAGCEIVRVAIPNADALNALPSVIEASPLPVVCDIHYDAALAFGSIAAGAHKIRINPGNLGSIRTRASQFKAILDAAKSAGAAVRIGVNSGSLEKDILDKHQHPTPDALAESALRWLDAATAAGAADIVVISIKSSDARVLVESNRILAAACDSPLHLGLTEAGDEPYGSIKSAAGLAPLLLDGIGDTIRVSLLGDPVKEIPVAYSILQSVGARITGPEIIACPTCGRLEVDLEKLVSEIRAALILESITAPVRISILGCPVNGPGEAREADIGIAAGRAGGVLFVRGEKVRNLAVDEFVTAVIAEVKAMSHTSAEHPLKP